LRSVVRARRCLIRPNPDEGTDPFEIDVSAQEGCAVALRDRGNHVSIMPRGNSCIAATAVDQRSGVDVCSGVEGQESAAQDQLPQRSRRLRRSCA
jgi:hypothetical protein